MGDPRISLDPNTLQRYAAEREKRLRPDGMAQYIDLDQNDRYKHLLDDPWVDHEALNSRAPALEDGSSIKFLILGAGYGGLLFAGRLIQQNFQANDIRLVDTAGGFGGTWYWNRYPGLACDIESYIYMPMLEETGYIPKHKYSYGPELQDYAERVADHFNLTDKALFRAQIKRQIWDEDQRRWHVEITEYRGPQGWRNIKVTAQFVMQTGGYLSVPHIPNLPGLDDFRGEYFHTSRWNYALTGGSPRDQRLEKLIDKHVGIIGTGSTSLQVTPALGQWAGRLYVFQRTPSTIAVRGQQETDVSRWAIDVANKPGWQRERMHNFHSWLSDNPAPGSKNLIDDSWTRMGPALSSLLGGLRKGLITPDKIDDLIAETQEKDFPIAEALRARVDETVKDKDTAEKLKAWYPTFCKRPGFNDDYLPTFNRPNVTLVDTNGKGVDRFTTNGIVVGGSEYPIDVLVFSTGFLAAAASNMSPPGYSRVTVIGRNGADIEEKWGSKGPTTLHSMCTNGFPNMFFASMAQAATSSSTSYLLDVAATHVAYIVAEATKRSTDPSRITVEAGEAAEEEWSNEAAKTAGIFAPGRICTPGYYNKEGEALKEG